MAQQGKLFPDPTTTIKVDAVRGEPRLWVRRLVLWAKPGETIREIRLRPGLNIIWSPDPGAPAADLGKRGGSGHGAGKTLFCRLLRYCLGEDTFATDELREAIGMAFPEGLVGAEVMIAGNAWGVVRPMGSTRKVLVGESRPEDLFDAGGRSTGMGPMLAAIREGVLGESIDEHMPGGREWKSWLLSLAWLTRDQECRFGHLLEWRHPWADSHSPVPGFSKEQLFIAVRLLLDSMTAVEMGTRGKLDALATEKQKLEHELAYLRQAAERVGPQLAAALQIEASLLGADSLAATSMQTSAQERLEAVEKQLRRDERDPDLLQLRKMLEEVIQRLAVLRSEEERTQVLASIQEEQIKALRGERANLDADEIKARLGTVCPVCNVPIDQALAVGCGLSHVVPDLGQIATDKQQLREQIVRCQQGIADYERQLREHKARRRSLENEEANLRMRVSASEKQSTVERAARRKEWLGAAQLAEDARKLSEVYAERDRVHQQIVSLEQEETRLKKDLHAHRQRHGEPLGRMEELFRYICRGLLGSGTEAALSFTSQGIQAEVQVGGTAMESLKAIAFDIAAMLMSIEGRTCLPAFLVHDSPREADLGLSHYHRLFRFMAKLEALGKQPPFQYIITTTTEPPEELRRSPYLVAELNGMKEDQRLLRRAL